MLSLTLPSALQRGWDTVLNAALTLINASKLDNTEMTPPIGYSKVPSFINAVASGVPVYQTQYFIPIDLGSPTANPGTAFTADAIMCDILTVYSGTTTPTINAALYPNDPSTGYPLTTSPTGIFTNTYGTLVTTAAGIKAIPFAAAQALPPGRYWLSFLLAGSAVSTAGAIECISGQATNFLPIPAAGIPGTPYRALTLTGLTALKTTATTPSAFVPISTNVCPAISLRRSA